MAKVIFLNGCGSSGKTSIARAIQHLTSGPWLYFSLDMFIDMLPERYLSFGDKADEGYFKFIPGYNMQGPTMQVERGPKAAQVFGLMSEISNILVSKDNNLIIDEVLFGDEVLQSYLRALKDRIVYFVGVFCELSVMQEREILRRDRAIGLANSQIDRVHEGLRDYDITVNTTSDSPFDIARKILSFVDTNVPQGFIRMRENLKL